MTPSTRALLDYLREDGRTEEPESGYEPSDDAPETRNMITMEMKKRRQQQILRQMLVDSGYGDLAKNVRIGKQSYEIEGDENG